MPRHVNRRKTGPSSKANFRSEATKRWSAIQSGMKRVLAILACPPHAPRIAVDQEAQALLDVQASNKGRIDLRCLPAADIDIIADTLKHAPFDVILVSAHGSTDGIDLVPRPLSTGSLVGADRLATLLNLGEHEPHVVVLLSCFSNHLRPTLAACAPILITALGKVSDAACIAFSTEFLSHLANNTDSFQGAFEHATKAVRASGYSAESFRWQRRFDFSAEDRWIIKCTPHGKGDTISVCLDDVKADVATLTSDIDRFLQKLSHKIAYHGAIFDIPRDRATLPIGTEHFGVFSWRSRYDLVKCHRLVRISRKTPVDRYRVWSRSLVKYNELASLPYRDPRRPEYQRLGDDQIVALSLFETYARELKQLQKAISALGLASAVRAFIDFESFLEGAMSARKRGDAGYANSGLEQSLSSLHDFVEALEPEPESGT